MKLRAKRLTIGTILPVVFAISLFFFYKRAKTKSTPRPLFNASVVLNQHLPKTDLVNLSEQHIEDDKLRHGKFVLAFMMPDCGPCDQENKFLKSVVDTRSDVHFLYVIPFGNKNMLLKMAHEKYAIEPVYDVGSNIAKALNMNQVPIKLFVEDGIIKRAWIDATDSPEKRTEFTNWLSRL